MGYEAKLGTCFSLGRHLCLYLRACFCVFRANTRAPPSVRPLVGGVHLPLLAWLFFPAPFFFSPTSQLAERSGEKKREEKKQVQKPAGKGNGGTRREKFLYSFTWSLGRERFPSSLVVGPAVMPLARRVQKKWSKN